MTDETEVPGQQTLDDVARPLDRAAIDEALRAPANGAQPARPARGPGGQFARKPATNPGRPASSSSPTADARDRADEVRLRELADELNADEAVMSSAQSTDECDDCPPDVRGRAGSRSLGVVVVSAAVVLGYIGLDLMTQGGLSRRLAGARWDDER
jgi:hypothetical protein